MRTQRTTGFTLVELLVVIIIVVMLAAIILPVFMNVGRNRNQTTCTENLRQVGINLALYQEDFDAYPQAPDPGYLQAWGADPTYLPFSDRPDEAVITFTGKDAAANDLALAGVFTGTAVTTYTVWISATGTSDSFAWSENGGSPQAAQQIDKTKDFDLSNGLTIRFANEVGHTKYDAATREGDSWTFTVGLIPNTWHEWEQLDPVPLTADAAAGADTVSLANVDCLNPGMVVTLRNAADPAKWETAQIKTIDAANLKVTFSKVLVYAYPANDGAVDPGYQFIEYANIPVMQRRARLKVRNFGLATLCYLYQQKEKEYNLRKAEDFHCPAQLRSAKVNQDANIEAIAGAPDAGYRKFDPLWAGYNTYDITYNYDQFDWQIREFDRAIIGDETAGLNLPRQLKERNVPADTVVAWCSGHRRSPALYQVDDTPLAPEPELANIAVPTNDDEDEQLEARVREVEANRFVDADLVLWLDGACALMRPRLTRGRDIGGKVAYYWVPPFLYSPGDWRK